MVEILTSNYKKYYNNSIISCAGFFSLIMLALAIALPILIVKYSGDSWNETMYYYEQPSVSYEDQMILFLTQDNKDETMFSTILDLNDRYDNNKLFSLVPMIKYEYFDKNNDGLIDNFKFKINIPLDQGTVENIKNIKAIFFFKYEFRANVVGKMNTVAIMDIDLPVGGSYIKSTGTLSLVQKEPIDTTTFFNEIYYENIYGKKTDNIYNYQEIIESYYTRDFYTKYNYETFIEPMRNPHIVNLEVNIDIPSYQKILYMTPIFTKFKFFWIQFIAIFIPVCVIIYLIAKFVFQNIIVPTIITTDIEIKKKKIL